MVKCTRKFPKETKQSLGTEVNAYFFYSRGDLLGLKIVYIQMTFYYDLFAVLLGSYLKLRIQSTHYNTY